MRAAAAVSRSADTAGSPFERFALRRPPFPLASVNNSHFMETYRDVALGMQYIQVGRCRWQAYAIFDIDRSDAKDASRMALLPPPTFIVVNPENGHAHVFWELSIPVRMLPVGKQTRYLRAIMDAYTNRLHADPSYVGLCAKNPLSRAWQVTAANVRYDLPTLAAPLRPVDFVRPVRSQGIGRNCDLFDWTRTRFAYPMVREFGAESAFAAAVLDFARRLNGSTFEQPLGDKEVGGIAKSVAKWTWERRERYAQGKRVRRGRMGLAPLPAIMEADAKLRAIRDRQAAAGTVSAEARAAATRARIADAVLALAGEGKRVSAAAVARHTGLAVLTVKRHRDLLPPKAASQKTYHSVYSGLEGSQGAAIPALVVVPGSGK